MNVANSLKVRAPTGQIFARDLLVVSLRNLSEARGAGDTSRQLRGNPFQRRIMVQLSRSGMGIAAASTSVLVTFAVAPTVPAPGPQGSADIAAGRCDGAEQPAPPHLGEWRAVRR